MTPLDALATVPFHEADAPARAAMLHRLAETELYLALDGEPEGLVPLCLPLEAGSVAVAADGDARLASALGRPVAHAALPGRALAADLARAGLGLLVNPGAPSEMLLDAAAVGWLAAALAPAPEAAEAPAPALAAPDAAMAALAPGLATRLAEMGGLARAALLVAEPGPAPRRHLLLLAGVPAAAQDAMARALAEYLAFLPPQPAPLDLGFPPALPAVPGGVTIRLEPAPAAAEPPAAARPPGDPAGPPPRLR